MTAKVNSAKELADAIERGEDTIEILGDLAGKTIRIRATGKVAWTVCIGCIGIALVALLAVPETAGTSVAVAGLTAGAATGILGISTTTVAMAIAIAAGGVGVLTRLRQYKEISRGAASLVLKRR